MGQTTFPSCQGNDYSGKDGCKITSKDRQILLIVDSIIRTDRAICHKDHDHRTEFSLPGFWVHAFPDQIDRLLGGSGEDSVVMVHIGTTDKVRER